MSNYYVDKRTMEVVKEHDIDLNMLSPEMYYRYIRGEDEWKISEKWYVGDGECLIYSYSIIDKYSGLAGLYRSIHFEENKAKPLYLISYTVPPSWFDKQIRKIEKR